MLLPLLVCGLSALSLAQKPQSACFSGVGKSVTPISTAFPQCNYLDNTLSSCSALPDAKQLGCLCKQKVFNAIIGCENEDRECLDSDAVDDDANQLKSEWHSKCDNYITFDVTTPKLSTLTATTGVHNNPDFCSYALSMCAVLTSSVASCTSAFSEESPKYSKCLCDDGILSVASVCEYDFNQTCVGVPAATTNIPFWTACSAQVSKFVATRGTTTSNLPTSLGPLTPGFASSKAIAGPSKSTGPAATGTAKSDATWVQLQGWSIAGLSAIAIGLHCLRDC